MKLQVIFWSRHLDDGNYLSRGKLWATNSFKAEFILGVWMKGPSVQLLPTTVTQSHPNWFRCQGSLLVTRWAILNSWNRSLGHGRPWSCSGSYSVFTDTEIPAHSSVYAFHSIKEEEQIKCDSGISRNCSFLFFALRFWGRFILV